MFIVMQYQRQLKQKVTDNLSQSIRIIAIWYTIVMKRTLKLVVMRPLPPSLITDKVHPLSFCVQVF